MERKPTHMKRNVFTRPLTAAAVVVATTIAAAQIERLDLTQMVSKADNAVIGKITNQEVIRIAQQQDEPEHYFTTLTIEGRSLETGQSLTVDVTFAGGFIDAQHGVYSSEAPSADDTRVGNQVVAFYKWVPNIGGNLAANSLYAAHGGLYRTFQNPKTGKTVVQGRGDGYALPNNVELEALGQQIAALAHGPQPK